LGKKMPEHVGELTRKRMKENNPMKNPEIQKKQKARELETKAKNRKPKLVKLNGKYPRIIKRKNNKIKQDMKEQIINLIKKRKTPVSETQERNILEKMILNNPMKNPNAIKKWKDTLNQKNILRDNSICELYKLGIGCRKIGRIFNLNDSSITYILKKNNIQKRNKKTSNTIYIVNNIPRFDMEKDIINLYTSGWKIKDIANKFKIGRHRTGRILRRNNILIKHRNDYFKKEVNNENNLLINSITA